MADAPSYASVSRGDPAPWFVQRATGNPRYHFDSVGGRYVVMCFYASSAEPRSRARIDAVAANAALFDGDRACFFGVTLDARDESEGRVQASSPAIRHFFDVDGQISRLYGAIPRDAGPTSGPIEARCFWLVLDPTLRTLANIPFAPDGSEIARVFDLVAALPEPALFAGQELQAPVLFLPNVFEPELCRRLIDLYETTGGVESGFMRQVDGRTVPVHDASHKKRRDVDIVDPGLIRDIQVRFRRRVTPEIAKACQFAATRMERYIVGCYSAEDGGHFRPHRDNTTSGTAHRRFAASVNLNEDFDGGEVSFPEYGPRSFKPPPGGAVVFSCSLLHSVSRVTRGTRYAFLPFLYDDAAAQIREANRATLAEQPAEVVPAL